MTVVLLVGTARAAPTPTNTSCHLIINEINADDPGKIEEAEFIELRVVCPSLHPFRQPLLNNYLIIIIEEFNPTLNGPAIVFSADLMKAVYR